MSPQTSPVRKRINQALDESSGTGRQRRIWALAGAGIGLDGYDLFIMSAALPLLRNQFDLTTAGLIAWLGAAAVIGAIPGALVAGVLADRFGRRVVLRVDVFLFAATAVGCALAWNPIALIALRLVQGFAIGAEYPISASLVAEVMPRPNRGRWMTGAFSFQAVGMVLAAGVSTVILLVVQDDTAWRWMLLSGLIPALVVGVARQGLPESPRWLARHGRTREAAVALGWLLGPQAARTVIRPHASKGKHATKAGDGASKGKHLAGTDGGAADEQPGRTGQMRELFAAPLRARTALVTIPWFVMDIALYGLGMFTPMIVLAALGSSDQSGGGSGGGSFLSVDMHATAAATLSDLFLVVGFVANILLVERAGRMRLQWLGFIGMAIGTTIIAATSQSGHATTLVIVGFVVFNLAVNLGPNATTYLIPAEVFPTRLRTTGHGFAAACGKLGAAVGVLLLPGALIDHGRTPVMLALGGLCVFGALVTSLLRFETRGAAID